MSVKFVKIDGGFTLRRLTSHVDGMARECGVAKSNPSETLAVNSETMESDDNELLSICQHRVCCTVVGIAVRCSDWPPDVQRAANMVCREGAAPTVLDVRRRNGWYVTSFF